MPQSSLLSPVLLTKLPAEINSRQVTGEQWELEQALLTEIQAREKAGVTVHGSHPNKHQPTGMSLALSFLAYCEGEHDSV